MNKNPLPSIADEYRELGSDLRAKERVLTAIFATWWAVNSIMIAWLLTTERLSAALLISVGLTVFVINVALNLQVRRITYIYHRQSNRLRYIQYWAGLYIPEPYRPWLGLEPEGVYHVILKSERVYHFIGITLIIVWFWVSIFGLVLAFHWGLFTNLVPE